MPTKLKENRNKIALDPRDNLAFFKVNSVFYPSGGGKLSTGLSGWGYSERRAFTCGGWQATLCDPISQVTLRSSVMGFQLRALYYLYLFYFHCLCEGAFVIT